MVTLVQLSPAARGHAGAALLRAPWYEGAAATGLALHRYLDEEFVDRFRRDLADRPEANAGLSDWREEDLAGAGVLKLRRPVHRAFYIAACEAVCDRPGFPALGPEHIAGAGLVIRRLAEGQEQGWMLADGLPLGWQPVDGEGDPDSRRRLPPSRRRAAAPPAAYTGEETHPLHPLLVRDSRDRLRCILFGYLPVGGADAPPSTAAAGRAGGGPPEELPWPFGLLNHAAPPPWSIMAERQVSEGVAAEEFAALLRLLVFRFQLATPEGEAAANAALWELLEQLPFHATPPAGLDAAGLRAFAAANPVRRDGRPLTLAAWLRAQAAGAEAAAPLIQALNGGPNTRPLPLPGATGLNLLVPEGSAMQLRAALRLRGAAALRQLEGALPRPRAGRDDLFVARPFLRLLCPDGCERILWGGASPRFRIAAPFDPEAARPVLIQMPSLADLRKGLARGASFNIPGDLMRHLAGLRSKDGASAALAGNPPGATGPALDVICSFSLPVITLCALILLMITVNLFNLVFWWLPWVVICLPLPR